MLPRSRVSELAFVLAASALAVHAQVSGPPNPQGLQCATNVSVTPTLRAEGYSEGTGDITLTCAGGTATAAGAFVPTVGIQVFLNAAVTSRLYPNGWSEALLIIDEPGSGLPGTSNT